MCWTRAFQGMFFRRRTIAITVFAAVFCALSPTEVQARSPVRHYSQSLDAEFYMDRFYFPGSGYQWAACVESVDDDSPLHAVRIRPGDIVTRLDNVRVTNARELDRHYCWTTFRFFRSHGDNPYETNRLCYNRRFHIPSESEGMR